ncbi:MAG: hypothetical protein M1538_01800 [Candidatus Marsarchaeota archaeon]|jgi:hypothetical protein|nr:hypothetical protein [Candidatus Marsarchaeota archaeon]
MEIISLKNVSIKSKLQLLKGLGYKSNGVIVLEANGKPHIDKYTNDVVKVSNMAILPGSTIVIDDNPVSIAAYLEEYGDVI